MCIYTRKKCKEYILQNVLQLNVYYTWKLWKKDQPMKAYAIQIFLHMYTYKYFGAVFFSTKNRSYVNFDTIFKEPIAQLFSSRQYQ